ncbi:MAG: bifunctional riboflavin kinase/FAD synthetase [Verrucomicrobiia bacterium]
MKVIRHAAELQAPDRKVCFAIGMFDGVHLGHQRVLQQTAEDAAHYDGISVAVTFDQHPTRVTAPERAPFLIYSLPQRLRMIGSLGIEQVLLVHFDRAFSEQSAEVFITDLASQFRIASVSVGSRFVFGHRRAGNVALLQKLGLRLGFLVHGVPPVRWEHGDVSSTRIRQAIQEGDLGLAARLLGRPYSVAGQVVPGARLGGNLGFPTANLDLSGLALPPKGVYAGRANANGETWGAVANLGTRPTLNRPEREVQLEVHLLDFSGDLYGHELEFQFGRRLRGEQKFASLEVLREQIGKDVAAARREA